MNLESILAELKARLPELAWQLDKPEIKITKKMLPKGMFKLIGESNASNLINEINQDILRLELQVNARAAIYLAAQINNKINVLVRICSCQKRTTKPANYPSFSLQKISTRQEWLNSMQQTIAHLTQQRDALATTLQNKSHEDSVYRLSLLEELGLAEKRLSQAEEAFERATA